MIKFSNFLKINMIAASTLLLCYSCQKKEFDDKTAPAEEPSTQLALKFTFSVDNAPFLPDALQYVNAAGNRYEVHEIKFFISDLYLHYENGDSLLVNDCNSIHYVDYDLPETQVWNVADVLPNGNVEALSFTFGLPPHKNESNYFTNPPENNMAWPTVLGGGYHFLQINGKWQTEGSLTVFNFHTGRGQIHHGDLVTTFVDNSFRVQLPQSNFVISSETTTEITIDMNINNWFCSPNVYDFNVWGGSIMQNQAAQEVIKENGHDVFSVRR